MGEGGARSASLLGFDRFFFFFFLFSGGGTLKGKQADEGMGRVVSLGIFWSWYQLLGIDFKFGDLKGNQHLRKFPFDTYPREGFKARMPDSRSLS